MDRGTAQTGGLHKQGDIHRNGALHRYEPLISSGQTVLIQTESAAQTGEHLRQVTNSGKEAAQTNK
jgi:hypothetical protein